MDKKYLEEIINNVASGRLEPDKAVEKLKNLPYEDMGFANLDHHRNLRTGYPETVFCQGKTANQIAEIMERLFRDNDNVIGTRASYEDYEAVKRIVPGAKYYKDARMIVASRSAAAPGSKKIAVVSAGTADIPVAEEAALTAEVFGNAVDRIYDVGVAGIHRLFAKLSIIREANVIIVVAGMEGALASVVGGLVDKPVIAVPTSVGYGANFSGVSALLTMLNSCSSGVSVVNIDNGYGAGYLASVINRL